MDARSSVTDQRTHSGVNVSSSSVENCIHVCCGEYLKTSVQTCVKCEQEIQAVAIYTYSSVNSRSVNCVHHCFFGREVS